MNYHYASSVCVVLLLLSATLSGCVAPPKEKPAITPTPGGVQSSKVPTSPAAVTTTGSYLKDATPFQTQVTPTLGIHTWTPTPTISQDQVCLVYSTNIDTRFGVKKTAKEFSLKNPPMYITYTITNPYYIKGTRRAADIQYTGQAETVSYKMLNPVAYLEITVRNQTSGIIYNQDGFGRDHGQYLNKTIKVTKPDDLLIEIGAYNVTGTVGVWVKPYGNLGENVSFAKAQCKNQRDFGPNIIVTTPTPKK